MKNNNLIPSLLIACGLFYVGANLNKEQETKVIQAEPVVAKTVASSTGVGDPVIVWYDTFATEYEAGDSPSGTTQYGTYFVMLRAWSDGTIEAKKFGGASYCQEVYECNPDLGWHVISSPQMACRTDINGNGEIEFGDLLAVLNDWGTETTCPDVVQLQCGLMEMN